VAWGATTRDPDVGIPVEAVTPPFFKDEAESLGATMGGRGDGVKVA
jgi:hypothetical protein